MGLPDDWLRTQRIRWRSYWSRIRAVSLYKFKIFRPFSSHTRRKIRRNFGGFLFASDTIVVRNRIGSVARSEKTVNLRLNSRSLSRVLNYAAYSPYIEDFHNNGASNGDFCRRCSVWLSRAFFTDKILQSHPWPTIFASNINGGLKSVLSSLVSVSASRIHPFHLSLNAFLSCFLGPIHRTSQPVDVVDSPPNLFGRLLAAPLHLVKLALHYCHLPIVDNGYADTQAQYRNLKKIFPPWRLIGSAALGFSLAGWGWRNLRRGWKHCLRFPKVLYWKKRSRPVSLLLYANRRSPARTRFRQPRVPHLAIRPPDMGHPTSRVLRCGPPGLGFSRGSFRGSAGHGEVVPVSRRFRKEGVGHAVSCS